MSEWSIPSCCSCAFLWKWFWKGSSYLWVGCTRLVILGEGEEEKQEAASQMALILEKVKIVRNGDGKIVSCFCFLILRPNAETISSAPFFSCSCSCSSVQQQNTKTSCWWSQMLQRHFLSLSYLEEQQFFYHNSSSEWILPNLLFIISSLPDPGDWFFAYIICVGISEEECGNSFLFFLFWLVAGVWCICLGKRRCPWHSSDPGMVGHRLWNQEACNWHHKQGLSGPDSWVCLEQPLYSPTHFSSHFLICFSIQAFSMQLKNISWGNSQPQRRRMVSHHLNQHCRIPSSVLVLSLVLNGLKA